MADDDKATGVVATAPANPPAVPSNVTSGEWWENSEKLALIQRAAKMFAASPLVPQMYQGADGLASCVIALNMAHRMHADPLMVMQNLYVVHGRPSWSAQFMVACFNMTGRFAPIRYTWTGKEKTDTWGCIAWSIDLQTGEKIEGPEVTIGDAKKEGWYDKKGSKWQTIPKLMLMYRAASWLVRTHAPELAMGLLSREEVQDSYGYQDEHADAHAPVPVAVEPAGGSRTQRLSARVASDSLSFEQLQGQCLEVRSLEDVSQVRSRVESSTLSSAQVNELLSLLTQAEDQFRLAAQGGA